MRVDLSLLNQPGWSSCTSCGAGGAYWVFPAYYRAEVEGQVAPIRLDAEASCYYHPEKAAAVACDGCGRFLCTVCDITLGKDHLCTSCLQSGRTHESGAKLETERLLHESITLSLAVLTPIVFWPLMPFTAPYVVYRSIRYFNKESSILGRARWKLVLALVLGIAEILTTAAVIYLIAKGI
jgi:hypothetical protein